MLCNIPRTSFCENAYVMISKLWPRNNLKVSKFHVPPSSFLPHLDQTRVPAAGCALMNCLASSSPG